MESQLLGLGVLLGAVTLVAGLVFAYPSDHKDWRPAQRMMIARPSS